MVRNHSLQRLLLFDPPRLFKLEVTKRIPGFSAVVGYRLPKQVGLRAKTALTYTGLPVLRSTPPTGNFGSLMVKKRKIISRVLL
jgi:hypothetical protein